MRVGDAVFGAVWDDSPEGAADAVSAGSVSVSALTGEHIGDLLAWIEKILQGMRRKAQFLIPFSEGRLVQMVHDRCEILSEEHTDKGTLLTAYLDNEMAGRLRIYTIGP